jgi:type 2 lantibiotic biosynthesis protein LanM
MAARLTPPEIITRSIFLPEFLNTNLAELSLIDSDKNKAFQRLAEWAKIVTQGEQHTQLLAKRLDWDGVNTEEIEKILGVSSVTFEKYPEYTKTLEKILEMTPTISSDQSEVYLDLENPLAFQEVLIPLVLVARSLLLSHEEFTDLSLDNLPLVTKTAYLNKLEHSLLQRLEQLTSKTLLAKFSGRRTLGENRLLAIIDSSKNHTTTVKYQEFVKEILSDGFLTLFREYPVLGRLIATIIDFWVVATQEFLSRIKADLPEINCLFNRDNQDGKVVDITTNLSDPHNQGRTVLILTFEDGFKLVYKPKDLSIEVAYNEFLNWCNQQETLLLPFKVLKVLNRHNYGWMEFVEQLPCLNEEEARRFYLRAGMLTCLLYVLKTTDCHYENLIAHGEHFVLIDGETVMHHSARLMEEINQKPAHFTAYEQIINSPIYTGLLPAYEAGPNTMAYDLSGLGGIDTKQVRVPTLKNINTDSMFVGYKTVVIPRQKNAVFLNQQPLSPNDYLADIVQGYQQMYRFFIAHQEVLQAEDGPLGVFRTCQIRFLNRNTRVYARILEQATRPEYLKNGLDFSIQLEALSRAYVLTEEKPHNFPLLAAELEQIQRLDIPFFEGNAQETAMKLSTGVVLPDYFQASSYSQVQQIVASLSEAGLSQHIAMLQLAFHSREAQINSVDSGNAKVTLSITEGEGLLNKEELIAEAKRIALEIESKAIMGADGSMAWIGLTHSRATEKFQIMPLAYHYYDGNCGIALFFAALYKVTGDNHYCELALGCIKSLREVISADDVSQAKFGKEIGLGGALGLPCIVHCFIKLGQFLGDEELIEEALFFARLITPDLIAKDTKYDVIEGNSGTILGLLALYEHTKDPEVLALASICGQHLSDYCAAAYSGNYEPKPLNGYAHGASGIAYALLRLYAKIQDQALLEGAENAIAYENKFFVPEVKNWQEIPSDTNKGVFWSTFCHGAVGIGLGLLGCQKSFPQPGLVNYIDSALVTTQKNELQIDHICCGNFGRVEILLVAARELSAPEYSTAALKIATAVVKRVKTTGNYELFGKLPTAVCNPSFYKGVSGIGYELLRLADPDLPSVLLWE